MSNHSTEGQQVVVGISVSKSGQATVDPALTDVLFDLALRLEQSTDLPVDVEHVLAAIVLAARCGELQAESRIDSGDDGLTALLARHVAVVFREFGGAVGSDD